MSVADPESAYDVLRAIRRIVRRISGHSKTLAKEFGLTVPQVICLKAIGEFEAVEPEVTAAMIAQHVQLSAATVTRILDRLQRLGLVDRDRRSRDRRKVCLSLTAAGRERYVSMPIPLQDEFVARFLSLDETDRQSLLDALNRITQLMEAEHIDAAPILSAESEVKE